MTRPVEAISRLWTLWSKAGGPVHGVIAVEYDKAARIGEERKAAGVALPKERPVRCRAALAINDDGSIGAATLIYPKR